MTWPRRSPTSSGSPRKRPTARPWPPACENWREQQRELDEQIANAEQAAATRRALRATTRTEAREMLTAWIQEDGTTQEEERAALAQLVERIEFDPATGEGRMHYRIGVNGTRFRLDAAATDLGLGKPGFKWRPRGFEPRLPR